MPLDNKGPGGIKNSYGTRTTTSPAKLASASPKDVYNGYDANGAVTATLDSNGKVTGLVGPDGSAISLGGGGLTTGRSITASGNAQLSDGGTIIQANSASAVAVTIPNDSTIAWANDTVIAIYQIGAGVVSFAAGAGVTLRTPTSYAAAVQYDTIFARKVGANEWVVSK